MLKKRLHNKKRSKFFTSLDWVRIILELIVLIFLIFTFQATKDAAQEAVKANKLSYEHLQQSKTEARFRYLTDTWNMIMLKSLDYPDYQDANTNSKYLLLDDKDRKSYETYGRWIGGYIEDLYINNYKDNGYNYYEPWIEDMVDLHFLWLYNNRDKYKHTPAMVVFIKSRKP